MHQTAIVPSKEAIELRKFADAITVRNKDEYTVACELVVRGRTIIKRRKAEDEPGIISAKAHLDLLKNEQKRHVSEIEEIIVAVELKAEQWAAEERRQAKIEQDRINEEAVRNQRAQAERDRIAAENKAAADRRERVAFIRDDLKNKVITKKQAEKLLREAGAIEEAGKLAASMAAETAKAAPVETVTVKAAIPTVSGIKKRVNYYAKCMSFATLFKALVEAPGDRQDFLCRFVKVDEVALNIFARETKDSKTVQELVPGVRAWEEDSL